MAIDKARASVHLKAFDFTKLFIEELGWDRPSARRAEIIDLNGDAFSLTPVAEKRGVRIFHCDDIPDRNIRQKIEREITKRAYEHLIIFTDPGRSRQVWQWVAREKGKPAAFREHAWASNSAPDPLVQKLDHIAFTLDEEETLTLAEGTRRMRDAFDREEITKRFYEAFKRQHDRFLGFIEGLTSKADKQWYASLMLNRLMFVYFIQKKRFLDNDIDYLKNRLARIKATQGADKFHSFYRAFLLKLFHGGLATPTNERDAETARLLGNIPYLNGGLFEPHALEADGHRIQIADAAFEAIFAFFDQYQWTLDTRPIEQADGREINPDVLGHIFEKYINQKQMGAYYTKEDITDYITKNTVIPWLFQNALGHDNVAFERGGAVWRLLSERPADYIYPALKRGANLALPVNIEAGIADVSKRGDWNKTASPEYGLPTETWREVVARRERYGAVMAKAGAGDIISIDELITYNLDIRQFARDAIQYAESPDLVRAFWRGIKSITVLDPACGSGAFLFASLNVLYDLYDACLERMEQFVAAAPDGNGPRQIYSDFREVLRQVADHPNRDYFIYKSIIIANLYGVDIMDEAVEICKLRLFLKLAAQLERADQIEPLPDIDFNIRAGNSLIGYTSIAAVEKTTAAAGFEFDDQASRIRDAAEELSHALDEFRKEQTQPNHHIEAGDKADFRRRLEAIGSQLNQFIAKDYGLVDPQPTNPRFVAWKATYRPFHWFIEFYGIISSGGFDVIVGNPPYLETKDVDYVPRGFASIEARAIHALFIERSVELLARTGGMSMILPMSLVSTQRMKSIQRMIEASRSTWYSNFSWRPAKLFDNVNRALTIFVSIPSKTARVWTTGYTKWTAASRDQIISNLAYVPAPAHRDAHWVPKFQHQIEPGILQKIMNQPVTMERVWAPGGSDVYYRTTGGLYWKVFTNFRPRFFIKGKAGSSSRETRLPVRAGFDGRAVVALLSSTTYWWWYTISSNLRDLNPADIQSFRANEKILRDPALIKLGEAYLEELEKNSVMLTREQKQTGTTQTQSFKIQRSKPIIDEIDRLLSRHYGFSAEETDFIVNYDIKYRMGASEDE
jgi:hypothetical protein